MPIINLSFNKPTEHPELSQELVAELTQPVDAGDDKARQRPYIVEEPVYQGDLFHVLVVWDKWQGVAIEDRGRIIMEAYAAVKGLQFTSKITLAMGLTFAETEKLDIGPPQIQDLARKAVG